MKITTLYRYEGYSGYNIKNPDMYLIIRETKCGWWVKTYDEQFVNGKWTAKEKWVSKTGKKRYAYPTKKEAMVNYKARKRSQIEWSLRNIKLAEKGLFNAGVTVTSVIKNKFKLDILDE